MTTEYSIQKMVSDGTLSTITLGIQYLQRNDIYIRIAGEETPQSGAPSGYTWAFINNTTIKILPVVPSGIEVVVYRRTDVDAMYNIYSQNAQFDESTIDENNTQLLYIAQEYLEQGATIGVDIIEFLRDDGTYSYYRLKRTDGSYSDEFTVPSAGNAAKVLSREAIRRSYANARYALVDGSFESGGTVTTKADVLLWDSAGVAYRWGGALPKVVPAGSTPTSSGGEGAGAWVNLSETVVSSLPFGDDTVGVLYRPGKNYESTGTVEKDETRPWYHDFRPLGVAQGGDAIFSSDGANMFMGPGAGNFTMRPLAVGDLPPGIDYNLQCSHLVAFGVQALGSVTIGYKNSAFGTNALRKLTTGHGDTATGRDAAHELTTGIDGTFTGFTAGFGVVTGNYHSVHGVSALYNNADGNGITANGRRAGFDHLTGSYDIFIGEQAANGYLHGSYSIFIGKQINPTGLTRGDSNLVIGSRLSGLQDEKEQVVIADGNGKITLEVHKDPLAEVKKASKLDLPSCNVTPFDATATDGQVDAGSTLLLRSLGNAANAIAQIVFQSRVGRPFSRIVSTGAGSGQMVFINDNVERLRILSAGGVNPGVDNTQPIGSASKRWSEIFAGTGTINTSDEREKSAPLAIDDAALGAIDSVDIVLYQWLDSITAKGDDARWHFGVIAQRIRDAFEAKGLDGRRYGLLCYDEWEDEYEEVLDDEGAPTGEMKLIKAAGNRWGIRADQVAFAMLAASRRRMKRIEDRLDAAGL